MCFSFKLCRYAYGRVILIKVIHVSAVIKQQLRLNNCLFNFAKQKLFSERHIFWNL